MKAFLRLIAFVLALSALCSGACAAQARSRVSFDLSADKSFDAPLCRWLDELCDMAVLTTGFYWGESGKYLEASLDMGKNNAIELRLIRSGGNVLIDGNLLDRPVMVAGVCDWADDMLDYAAFGLKTPSSGSATILSNEGAALALKSFCGSLRAIAAVARGSVCRECENCGTCENCQTCDMSLALAMFAGALADRLDASEEHNALIIRCQRLEGEMKPFVIENYVEAGDGLAVEMVKRAIISTTEAIAENA